MSDRRAAALATLRRVGLELDAAGATAGAEDRLHELLAGADAVPVAEALGEVGGDTAARALARVAAASPGGALRRAVRRALFRLAQRGVSVPEAPAPAAPAPVAGPDIEGLISPFDGRGDRVIWLLRPQAGGGTLLLIGELNEPAGLQDVRLAETTRRELRAIRERLQREAGLRLVPADWRLLDALLVESHQRAGAAERRRDYLRLRPEFTTAPPLPAAEPRSVRAAPPASEERAGLLAGSAELLALPEMRTWWPDPEAAAPFVAEIAAVRDSPLVLNRMQQEERLQAILGRAAVALFPRQAVARRLEGTAYVLAETGRVPAARQALAVASALREGYESDQVPLLRALVQQTVAALFQAEQSRREEERRGALVVTPGEALTAPGSSRPGRTRS